MSRYRTIEVSVWNSGLFRSLSDDAKLLWFHLRTSPATAAIPGVVVIGPAGLAEAMEWSPERLRERLRELFAKRFVKGFSDEAENGGFTGRFLWLPDATKSNPPANPNGVKSWAKSWQDDIPDSPLKSELRQAIKPLCERFGKRLGQPFGQLFPEPFLEQEQEQEQEQEYTREPPPKPPPSKPKPKRKPAPKAHPDRQRLIARVGELYEAKYEGEKHPWEGKQREIANRLVKAHGLAECLRKAELLYRSPPKWAEGPFDIGSLESLWPKLVPPEKLGGPRELDEYELAARRRAKLRELEAREAGGVQ